MGFQLRLLCWSAWLWLLGACVGGNSTDSKKLDDIVARLDRIEKKVDTAGRPQRTPPGMPQEAANPNTVYSVPVDGDPIEGPKVAKITIVEASDYA